MQCACAVLHSNLWEVCVYHIFTNCLINGTSLKKQLLNMKCVLRCVIPVVLDQ